MVKTPTVLEALQTGLYQAFRANEHVYLLGEDELEVFFLYG